MEFRKTYERKRMTSNPGCRMENEYKVVKDDDGDTILKKVGEYCLYDQIQSYKDSCDLNKIIEKFKITGDPSLLMQKQTFYADVTEYPKSYAEMLQTYQAAKEFFYSLPVDDRAKFNNDPDQFYSSIGSETFNSIFSITQSESVDVVEESEVVTNE